MQNINCWESKFQPCQYSDQLLNAIAYLNTTVRMPTDIQTIKKANFYARVYHGDQIRKSGEPYYSHPLIVAYLFAFYVGKNIQKYYTTELIVIAILHDTIEDTRLTYEMIVEIFGKRIADGVQDLSRVVKNGAKHKACETLYILESEGKIDIMYIKIFDRFHNVKTIHFMPNHKQLVIIGETRDHFLPFVYKYELNEVGEELREICAEITHPNQPYLQEARGFNSNCQLSSQVFQNGIWRRKTQ